MKRIYLLLVALVFSTAMIAQNRTTIVHETFDSFTMPTGWSISGYGQYNWEISCSDMAGGNPNELKFLWNPSFDGISRVVTPPVNLNGINSIFFSLKHYLDNYSGSSSIGVATSSDNGATWNSIWEQSYSTSGQYEIMETISTPDMGKVNVLFCIYFSGNNYNINNWYFDDFEVFSQENLDLRLVSIDVPSVTNIGELEVSFTVQNLGLTAIESFAIETQIIIDNNNIVDSETFGTYIAPNATYQFTLGTTFNLGPDTYHLTVDIVEVNGTLDHDLSNNTLTKTIGVPMGFTQKIPMIEHFSSSTCGPSIPVNEAMNQLTANNQGKYTYTKYPMNWPGSGDPYYTDDGGERKDFYGCIGTPQLFLDGVDQGAGAVTQGVFDTQYNTPAFANVRGSFYMEGATINIIADFMSYVDLTDVIAFISVNEKTTTGNVGGNGETEFHHIMMDMPEYVGGNVISINAGEYQRLEFSYDILYMHNINIEDINDLEVSLWLQDYTSKEIYNSHFAYEYTPHSYPVQNMTANFNSDGSKIILEWDAPEANAPTGYNIYIDGELVAVNYNGLTYENTELAAELYTIPVDHIAEVVAVYSNGKTSVGVVKSFASGNNDDEEIVNHWTPNTSLYPNNMTVIGVLEIDDVEQNGTNWEIGAFCGDEVRGSAKAQYIPSPVNRYEYFLMVYGEAGDEITFRLYDHSTGLESDLMTNNVESFVVNGAIGDIMNPYVISFASDITQSYNLQSGWNWYSTYIEVEGSEGLEMMQEGLGDDAIQIKSHSSGFVNYEAGIWFGGLTEIKNEEMYMIKMSSSHVLEMTGSYGDPSAHPITLGINWKWIGYPVDATMSVSEALSNLSPNNGDYVKSQFHFAQYYEGLGWTGTLGVMEPGRGYMYQNTSGTVKTLVYPTPSSKGTMVSNVTTENNRWVADGREYPTNMTVIAVVEGAGTEYEVAAFSGGECRGSARPIYVEQLDSYMIFMTVYGEDGDEITFRYYDVITGEEQAIEECMIFGTDATFGDVMNPYVMMMSPTSIGEGTIETLSIYPNPVGEREEIRLGGEYDVVEVYNSIGVKVAEYKNVSKIDGLETSGVYVVRIMEGDKVAYDRIVVE